MDKAIFLDRDGTINEDIGDLYIPEKLIFISQAIKALRILQERFLLFVITNQSGVGKGIFSRDEFAQFNDYFVRALKEQGVNIKEIFCCPHTKEEKCICRKPNPYFIERTKKAYDIDVGNSYCIGDHPHDIEMAKNAGTYSVFVLTGHGTKHKAELSSKPDHIANNLYEAALWIKK